MCNSYRDVLLADDSGKAVGRLIRKKLFPKAAKMSMDTQFGGGLNGGETAFAHLYVMLTAELRKHKNLSYACLFLDVVAAF